MVDLLASMRERFDTILIDTPPLLPVTDAAVAAVRADGAILVVRAGRTSRPQVATAQRALEAVDARLLGCVINMVPRAQEDYYHYRSEQRGTSTSPAPTKPESVGAATRSA
jgi:Mrp family chromosome partitioning ATPase